MSITCHWRKSIVLLAMLFATLNPAPVQGQGLLSLFSSLCVEQGCTVVPGHNGHPVTLEYYLPKNASSPAPAVLLLHGSDGMMRHADGYRTAAKGLAAQGYAAFIVHYYQGAPGFPIPGPEDRSLPDPRAFIEWLATVNTTIGHISAMPCVDRNRIGLLGFSLGGYLAASQASIDPRIRSVSVLSAGMPAEFATKLKHMPPTLIVHGDCDPDVPVAEALRLADVLARHGWVHDLFIMRGEGHLPYQCYTEAAAKRVLSWFDCTL